MHQRLTNERKYDKKPNRKMGTNTNSNNSLKKDTKVALNHEKKDTQLDSE